MESVSTQNSRPDDDPWRKYVCRGQPNNSVLKFESGKTPIYLSPSAKNVFRTAPAVEPCQAKPSLHRFSFTGHRIPFVLNVKYTLWSLLGKWLRCFHADTPILDGTIAIVEEKVWSFRTVLKAAAEALVGFGLSPKVVGYESVPMGEDEQLALKDEAESALQKVAEKERLGKYPSSSSMTLEENNDLWKRTGEAKTLVKGRNEDEDTDHAFVETIRKEKEERKSLTRRIHIDEEDD